jgi:hypothetical protein
MVSSPSPELEKEERVKVRVDDSSSSTPEYTLYKWRFPGVFGLVVLNIAAGLNWPWFGSISAQSILLPHSVRVFLLTQLCSCHRLPNLSHKS